MNIIISSIFQASFLDAGSNMNYKNLCEIDLRPKVNKCLTYMYTASFSQLYLKFLFCILEDKLKKSTLITSWRIHEAAVQFLSHRNPDHQSLGSKIYLSYTNSITAESFSDASFLCIRYSIFYTKFKGFWCFSHPRGHKKRNMCCKMCKTVLLKPSENDLPVAMWFRASSKPFSKIAHSFIKNKRNIKGNTYFTKNKRNIKGNTYFTKK